MTHRYKTYYHQYSCPCGKEFSGDNNKVKKLMNLHQKICKDSSPIQIEQRQLKISHIKPLSGNGEKEFQMLKKSSNAELAPIIQSNSPIEKIFKINGKLYSNSGDLPINK